MLFAEYQQFIQKTAFYPGMREIFAPVNMEGLTYTALGLVGESGEVADKLKKVLRDDGGQLADEKREALILEMGDVLWYLTAMANELGISMDVVARKNIAKIEGRTERGTRQGSGDDR